MILPDVTSSTAVLFGLISHGWGVAAFVGVYVVLLIWLFFMPERLLGEPAGRPWWQSSRLWAIAITLVQILVYLGFG